MTVILRFCLQFYQTLTHSHTHTPWCGEYMDYYIVATAAVDCWLLSMLKAYHWNACIESEMQHSFSCCFFFLSLCDASSRSAFMFCFSTLNYILCTRRFREREREKEIGGEEERATIHFHINKIGMERMNGNEKTSMRVCGRRALANSDSIKIRLLPIV